MGGSGRDEGVTKRRTNTVGRTLTHSLVENAKDVQSLDYMPRW